MLGLLSFAAILHPARQPLRPLQGSHPPRLTRMSEEYDLGAAQFDLLEMRSVRRDAMLQYAVSQRSQQLRILFFASSAVVAAAFPVLIRELIPDAGDVGAVQIFGSMTSALAFGGLAAREKRLRGKVLVRLERELELGEFSIYQPESAALGGRPPAPLAALRGQKRLVAMYGTPATLSKAIRQAAVYRRRLSQSGIVLVAVASGDGGGDGGFEAASAMAVRDGWLWLPSDLQRWVSYFEAITAAASGAAGSGAWFGLSLTGRSCASGVGEVPWDELLGTVLPPLKALSPDEPPSPARTAAEQSVLAAQRALYDRLSAADDRGVAAAFAPVDDEEVSRLQAAGRLDNWATVLKYDATVGLQLSSQEATVDPNGREACTTALEWPQGGNGGSLLCTQRWVKAEHGAEGGEGEWLLAQHRTIPYTQQVDAAACLRCDHRGCVALQRTGAVGAAGMPGDGV